MSALANGTVTNTALSTQTATMAVSNATGGTAPYVSYQWYRSTTSGFTPGAGNILAGQVAQTLNDTGLIPNITYYYVNKVTDSASPANTALSTQVGITTQAMTLNQNQFNQLPVQGMLDQAFDFNTIPCLIDSTQSGSLYPGAPVKNVANTVGGTPHVVGCTADSDQCFGFINYNIKNIGFIAGQPVEVSIDGNVMWVYSTTAIIQGAQCQLDVVNGGVAAAVTSSGAEYVGWAFDGFSGAGSLGRMYIKTPSFKAF